MKSFVSAFLVIVCLASWSVPALAAGVADTRQEWLQAQQTRIAADATYKQAQIDYRASKTPENDKEVVDTAKALMNAALDEAAAWLRWKDAEAQGDPRVPAEIRNAISADVAANLQKIVGYRADVAAIQAQIQIPGVFLKLVGGYTGLLTDVARNSGALWAAIGTSWVETASTYATKLRTAAADVSDNAEILAALDAADAAIAKARTNVAAAKDAYALVRLPGTPFIKFAQGNASLRLAQTQLLEAQAQLVRAFTLIGARSR